MEPSPPQRDATPAPRDPWLRSALEQLREDCRRYNRAVGNYNTHLDADRESRDLHDLPFRAPVTAHEAFEAALAGDAAAIRRLLEDLIDRAHLDSRLRRHPRVGRVHVEAVDHLETARDQLIATLEEALLHRRETDGAVGAR